MASGGSSEIGDSEKTNRTSPAKQYIEDFRANVSESSKRYQDHNPGYNDLHDSDYHTPRFFDPSFFVSPSEQLNDEKSPRFSVLKYFRELLLEDCTGMELQSIKDVWDSSLDVIPLAREVAQSPGFPGIINFLLESFRFIVIDDTLTCVEHLLDMEKSTLLDMKDCVNYMLDEYPNTSADCSDSDLDLGDEEDEQEDSSNDADNCVSKLAEVKNSSEVNCPSPGKRVKVEASGAVNSNAPPFSVKSIKVEADRKSIKEIKKEAGESSVEVHINTDSESAPSSNGAEDWKSSTPELSSLESDVESKHVVSGSGDCKPDGKSSTKDKSKVKNGKGKAGKANAAKGKAAAQDRFTNRTGVKDVKDLVMKTSKDKAGKGKLTPGAFGSKNKKAEQPAQPTANGATPNGPPSDVPDHWDSEAEEPKPPLSTDPVEVLRQLNLMKQEIDAMRKKYESVRKLTSSSDIRRRMDESLALLKECDDYVAHSAAFVSSGKCKEHEAARANETLVQVRALFGKLKISMVAAMHEGMDKGKKGEKPSLDETRKMFSEVTDEMLKESAIYKQFLLETGRASGDSSYAGTDTSTCGSQTNSFTMADNGSQTDCVSTDERSSADLAKAVAAAEARAAAAEDEKRDLAKRLTNSEDIVAMLLDVRRRYESDIQRLNAEKDQLRADRSPSEPTKQPDVSTEELDKMCEKIEQLTVKNVELVKSYDNLEQKNDRFAEKYDKLVQENKTLAEERDKILKEKAEVVAEKEKLAKEKGVMCRERESLVRIRNELMCENSALSAKCEELQEEKDFVSFSRGGTKRTATKDAEDLAAKNATLTQKNQLLAQEKATLSTKVYQLAQEKDLLAQEKEMLAKKHAKLVQERDKSVVSRDLLSKKNNQMSAERDKLSKAKEKLTQERDALSAEKDKITIERNRALKEKEKLVKERDNITKDKEKLTEANTVLVGERDKLSEEKEQQGTMVEQMSQNLETMRMEMGIICRERESLVRIRRDLLKDNMNLTMKCDQLLEGKEGGTIMQDKENMAVRTRLQYFQRLHDEKCVEVSALKKAYFSAQKELGSALADVCLRTYNEALSQLTTAMGNRLLEQDKKTQLAKLRDRLRERRDAAEQRNAKLVEVCGLRAGNADDVPVEEEMPQIQEAEIPDEVYAALYDIMENYQQDPDEDTTPFENILLRKPAKKPPPVENGKPAAPAKPAASTAKPAASTAPVPQNSNHHQQLQQQLPFPPASTSKHQPPPPNAHFIQQLQRARFDSIPLPPNHPHNFRPPPLFPPQQMPPPQRYNWPSQQQAPDRFFRPPMNYPQHHYQPHQFRPPRHEGFRLPFPHDRNHPNFINDLLGYTDSVVMDVGRDLTAQRPGSGLSVRSGSNLSSHSSESEKSARSKESETSARSKESETSGQVKEESGKQGGTQAALPKLQPVATDYTPQHASAKSQSTFHRLMTFLVKKFPNNTIEELQESVKTLREENNNTLHGMSMDGIMSLIEELLLKKAKSNKKPAWGTAGQSGDVEWKNPMDDMECAICIDIVGEHSATTLRCNHVFHTMCIKTWLSMNSVCPKCMRHVVMSDEFPPLK